MSQCSASKPSFVLYGRRSSRGVASERATSLEVLDQDCIVSRVISRGIEDNTQLSCTHHGKSFTCRVRHAPKQIHAEARSCNGKYLQRQEPAKLCTRNE